MDALQAAQEREVLLNTLVNATPVMLKAELPDEAIVRLADALVNASEHIRLVWYGVAEFHDTNIRPMMALGPARSTGDSLILNRLQFEPRDHVYALPLPAHDSTIHSALGVPIELPGGRRRAVLAVFAGPADYFQVVGASPFRAFGRVAEAALEQTQLKSQLRRLASVDLLTDLLTRRAMNNLAVSAFDEAENDDQPVSIALLDIDHFKKINDTYGHDAGDEALKAVSNVIRQTIRGADFAARWGGEEMLVLLPNTDRQDAVVAAERLRSAIENTPIKTAAGIIKATVSIGVAVFPEDAPGFDPLLKRADERLYVAKTHGRNCIVSESDAVRVKG